MSKKIEGKLACPNCVNAFSVNVHRTLWLEFPENMKLLTEDDVNVFTCPQCEHEFQVDFGVFFTNSKKEYAVWFEPHHDSAIDEDMVGYKRLDPKSHFALAPRFKTMDQVRAYVRQKEGEDPTGEEQRLRKVDKILEEVKRTGKSIDEVRAGEFGAHVQKLKQAAQVANEIMQQVKAKEIKNLMPSGPDFLPIGLLAVLLASHVLALVYWLDDRHSPLAPPAALVGLVALIYLWIKRNLARTFMHRVLWGMGFEVAFVMRKKAHRFAHLGGIAAAFLFAGYGYSRGTDEYSEEVLIVVITTMSAAWGYILGVLATRGGFWAVGANEGN